MGKLEAISLIKKYKRHTAVDGLSIPLNIGEVDVLVWRNGVEILPSIERRAEAAKLLGLSGDEEIVPRLIGLLDDEQYLFRFEASLAVLNLRETGVPDKIIEIIKSSFDSLNLERKLRAEEALCSMNISADRFQ